MSAKLTLDVRGLITALASYGADVANETDRIVESNAQLFAADLPTRYPSVDEDLRNGVRLTKVGPRRFRVRSTARHAHLYEYGTVRRFTAGTGAYRGIMPAKPTFVPWAIRARERMMTQIRAYLQTVRAKGLTGTPTVRQS